MSKYGIHSGLLKVENVKVGEKFVHNRNVLKFGDFDNTGNLSGIVRAVPTALSGVAAGGSHVGPNYLPPAGDDSFSVKSYAFEHENPSALAFNLWVPDSIPRKVKANIRLVWMASGSLGGSHVYAGSGVVWDLDYRVFDFVQSGTTTAQQVATHPWSYHLMSGALYQASTIGSYRVGPASICPLMSGTFAMSNLEIPSNKFQGGSIIMCRLIRDTADAADNYFGLVYLLFAVVEYIEDNVSVPTR